MLSQTVNVIFIFCKQKIKSRGLGDVLHFNTDIGLTLEDISYRDEYMLTYIHKHSD